MAAKAFPGISLRALLENGHFGQTRKKGLTKISLKEKRIFAVILAHTMLQLCGGPWIQETWDAENIFFMFDPETQKLFDFYRPYIASPLESDQLADVSCDDRMHKYPLILDFARILLEIEYGETIKATEEDYDAETHKETQDTPFFMIDRVLNEIADDVYQDYRNAISACLDIEKFLPHGGFFDDPEFQQSIYKYIVAPLEDELFKAFKLKADELYLMNRHEDTATHNRATINIWSVTETPLQDNQLKVPPMVSGSTHVENTTLESSGSIVIRESQTTPSISSTTTYTPDSYTVAIVCPMGIEMAPVVALLDKDHPDLSFTRRTNTYTLGQIGEHNVVITVMPEIGNSRAASVVTQLQNDFQSLQFGLLVGIGGGIPDLNKNDIRLGDVVVSKPTGAFGGVVQFDRGKTNVDNRFERTGSLNKPPQFLMASLEKLSAQHRIKGNQISHNLSIMLKRCPQMAVEKYIHQGEENDVLFKHTYMHKSSSNCKDCREDNVVERPPRRSTSPVVHYGTIGSANTVVKDANTREKLKQDLGIICVEMEAAGLMDEFPCLVIRGICDYADSHKNKMWQPYAASTAAAFAKELLSVIPA
jgi:nucleoside phosphorylase